MLIRSVSTMDVLTGTSADAWSATVDLAFATALISLECWDENMDIRFTYDGTTFYDSFELDVDRPLLFPLQAVGFQHKNHTPGSIARYQVAGMN